MGRVYPKIAFVHIQAPVQNPVVRLMDKILHYPLPRGSIWPNSRLESQRVHIHYYIMELGPKNHNGDGLLGPNSIMVVYMDPLGYKEYTIIPVV